jgi:hypothetical protein
MIGSDVLPEMKGRLGRELIKF